MSIDSKKECKEFYMPEGRPENVNIPEPASRDDWDTEKMPFRRRRFTLVRTFTPEEMEVLRRGHVPEEMEDKWFWYMEGDTLYAHRSWSGVCIYIVKFGSEGRHSVTVNRKPSQYSCRSLSEDRQQLNRLLDFWCRASYDYYTEWISETAEALHKNDEARGK